MELRFYEEPDTVCRIFMGTGSLNEKSGKSCADQAKTCSQPGTRDVRSAKLRPAACCKSSTCLMKILIAYS